MIKVLNNGYLIALLLFLAGSIASLCDGVAASRRLGVADLAAIGIVYPYTKAMECISLMLSGGSQVIIGRRIGQNRFEDVSRVFYTSLVFTAALSLLIAVSVGMLSKPLSLLLGAGGDTLQPTMDYLVSLTVGAPAHLLTLYMIPLFQLDEKKRLINLATIVMTVVNVGLNILFILRHMGIKGIGYSTSISYYAALLILSFHFFEKKACIRGKGKNGLRDGEQEKAQGILLQGSFGVNPKYLPEIIREGAPSAFRNVSSIIFNTSVNHMLSMVGTTEAVAAFSVYKMTKFIFLSVSEAIINPVRMIQSMLREEKDHRMMKRVFRYSMIHGFALSSLLCVLLWFFGRNVFSFMVSGPVLDETMSLMRWTIPVYLLNIVVCYYLAYFQAIGKKKTVYSVSVVHNIVIIPVFYLLARQFGARGIWMGHAAQTLLSVTYMLACACFMGRKNRGLTNKLMVLPPETDCRIYDYHIDSREEAAAAVADFGAICQEAVGDQKKASYCALALEEMVFNLLEYQKHHREPNPDIDIHIVVLSGQKMILRIKDCSREHNPFVKYEYCAGDDDPENIGIRIVRSFAQNIEYSFIYGVNFISVTV